MNAQDRGEIRCSLAAEVLRSCGALRLQAVGSSMLPSLWPGDVLTVQGHDFERIQPGDIVLYARGGRFFVHRVRKKSSRGGESLLITRGDSMPQDDPPVGPTELLGCVTEVQRRGSSIAPTRVLSPFRLVLARLLCHWDLCRSFALRLHALRSGAAPAFESAP